MGVTIWHVRDCRLVLIGPDVERRGGDYDLGCRCIYAGGLRDLFEAENCN